MINNFFTKYHALPVTIKATFWFTICSFILKGISFITVPIFASILSTTEYGKMSIYYSYEQIFLIFATLEMSIGAYQRGILDFKDDNILFTSSLIVLGNILTILLFAIFSCFSGLLSSLTNMSSVIMVLMFSYFFVQPAYNAWLTKKRFSFEYKPAVISTILFTLSTTLISLLFVDVVQKSAQMKIGSMLIVELIFCIPFYLKNVNFKLMLKNPSKVIKYWKYCLRFQLPLLFHSLSYLVLSQSDRIMIGALVNESKAAIYSVAYNLGSVVIIFQQSINQVFKPRRYQQMESKDYGGINKANSTIMVFLVYVITVFLLIVPDVVYILFNVEYYESIWTIIPVSIGVFFMYLYSVFSDIESYFHKTKYMAYASMICAILNIILNYIGIKVFGYIACAYTTLFSYIFLSLIHYLFMKKTLREYGITDMIYNLKNIMLCSILLLITGGFVMVGYKLNIVRYLQFGLTLALTPIIIKELVLLLKNK